MTVTFPEPLLTVTLAMARLRSPTVYRKKRLWTLRSNNWHWVWSQRVYEMRAQKPVPTGKRGKMNEPIDEKRENTWTNRWKAREHINLPRHGKLGSQWLTSAEKIASVQSRFVFVLIGVWLIEICEPRNTLKYKRPKLNCSTYPLRKPLLSHLAVKEWQKHDYMRYKSRYTTHQSDLYNVVPQDDQRVFASLQTIYRSRI